MYNQFLVQQNYVGNFIFFWPEKSIVHNCVYEVIKIIIIKHRSILPDEIIIHSSILHQNI